MKLQIFAVLNGSCDYYIALTKMTSLLRTLLSKRLEDCNNTKNNNMKTINEQYKEFLEMSVLADV